MASRQLASKGSTAVRDATARSGRLSRAGFSRVAGVVLLIVIVLLVVGFRLTPWYHPYEQDLDRRLLSINSVWDGHRFLLGTDELGRDELSRLSLAGGVALRVAIGAVLIEVVLGTALGLMAGYFRGPLDRAVSMILDLQMAVPRIMLLVAAIAVFPRSLLLLTVLMGLSGWMPLARVVRSSVMPLREAEFVLASKLAGASSWRIMIRHLLPQIRSNIVILAASDLGAMVLLEAALSYLGLGVIPPDTSWGLMILDAQSQMASQPSLIILPGIAIFMVVAGSNFLSMEFTDEDR